MKGPLEIQYLPLESLRAYARNSTKHPPRQIELLQRLLLEYGWATPMGMAGGTLIYGHARHQAACALRDLGQAIPGNPDPDYGPVVDLSHLSKAQRRAYVIADNESARKSIKDMDVLALEIGDLRDLKFDLTLTGIDDLALQGILDPHPPEEPVVRKTVKTVQCPECHHEFSP